MIKFLTILFILFLILGPKHQASASENPIINEFSAATTDDWVEIYNPSASTQSVEGWVIRDSTDNNKKTLTGSICSNGTRKIDFSNWLNNSGDTIRLLISELSTEPVSTITYYSSSIPEHQDNQSTSRSPDGSNNWTVLTPPTPNDNTSCNPSPTPNPTATPAATSTPEPTSSPNLIATPNPDSSPTSASPSTKKSSPSPQILGETSMQEATPSPESSPDSKFKLGGESKTKAAAIITGSGLVLIGISVGFYFWYNKISKSEKEQDSDDEQHLQ